MDEPSDLERFLRARGEDGLIESQGCFTLDRQQAIRKIAEYQLPFSAAWAVKIVQAIVAGGTADPIKVALKTTEIVFSFQQPGFTLEEFEERFYNPEPPANRSLRHLLSGLWAVSLREMWGFLIAFPGQSRTLIWDGQVLQAFESSPGRDCAVVCLAPLQPRASLSWVAGVARSGNRNAEVLLALTGNCYACPVPLTVDGRRLDSLLRAETHGLSKYTYPITIGFADPPLLPDLPIPPGTFEGPPKLLDKKTLGRTMVGWKAFSEKRMRALTYQGKASLVYVLSVHLQSRDLAFRAPWQPSEAASTVYWVLDGSVVFQEKLIEPQLHCSAGCFVSAQGLETDLTTFQLAASAERDRRLQQLRATLLEQLSTAKADEFDQMVSTHSRNLRIVGGVTLVLSVGSLVTGGGGFWSALLGVIVLATGGSDERNSVEGVRDSLRLLQEHLRSGEPREP